MSMVWPTLGSRTEKEQNKIENNYATLNLVIMHTFHTILSVAVSARLSTKITYNTSEKYAGCCLLSYRANLTGICFL